MQHHLLKADIVVLLIAGAVGGIVWAIEYASKAAIEARHGPVHRYELNPDEAFLTEAHAVSIVQEVMARDGYSPDIWKANEDRRTKAPDGATDVYLVRNTRKPNSGFILYVCTDPSTPNLRRSVDFRPEGRTLVVRTYCPK